MCLRIIYGKAGTGKSEFIYKEINKKINLGIKDKVYIITPEQFSYTAEKKLMENNKSIVNAEVITFNRMAYRVKNEIGGCTNVNLTKSGKSMIIYSILQKQKSNLNLLNKTDENIDLAMRTISEFKKNNISLENIKNKIDEIEDNYLKMKLKDIYLIYKNFENKIYNKYIDETDLLSFLADNIEKINLFKNAIFYIDEFSGFTKQELEIIKKILKISKKLTMTFCIDNLDFNTIPDVDIFYSNKITLNKIFKLLNDDEKIEIINLEKNYRFKNTELIFLEKYLYNKKIEKYTEKIKNIKLYLAQNKFDEIEEVAKNIIFLVKNKNYKYNEIAVITKNINNYSALFKSIFNKYNIPIYIDEKKDLNQNILIKYILSILEIILKNYSYESVFNYLKINIQNLNEEDIFIFEKYCIKYGIKNNKFKKDFIYGINENNKQEINYLNNLRIKILQPIFELEKKINKKQDIINLIKYFYDFLIEQKIDEIINCSFLKNNIIYNEDFINELKNEYKMTYNIIINLFDEIIEIFKDEKMSLDNFYKILKIGLKNSSLGKIPSNQDSVIIGDTERSRTHKVNALFIIGINDGIFPNVNRNEGFFNDSDRIFLKENGLEIAKGSIENLYDDNFNIYKAFTTAENKLFLSYSSSDTEGKNLRPSILLTKIKKIFINLKEKNNLLINKLENYENNYLEKNNYIFNKKIEYEKFIFLLNNLKENNNNFNIKENKNIYKNIFLFYKYFSTNEVYKKVLHNNLEYIDYLKSPEKIKKENIEKLYGNKINTSISKLETYSSCPYEYFLKYSLKIKDIDEFKIKNLDTGNFMHEVISLFFEKIKIKKLNIRIIDNEQINNIIEKIIDEKLKENKNYIFVATEKYKFLVKRLKRIIFEAMLYIINSIKQSDFDVFGTEVSFTGKNNDFKPIIINLENNKKIEIVGKIDRVDIAKNIDGKYIRIIDYKSSIKDLDYTNIYAGLQLQLVTYLDAVCKMEDFIPAGILYFNLLEQMINVDKKLTDSEIEEKIKNSFKMKGLILADVKVAKMQDHLLENSKGSKLIPAYIDSKGNLSEKKSNIATREEFEKIEFYVNNIIKKIVSEILDGNIKLKPYYKNKKTPCEFCDYKNVCEFNSGLFKTEYRFINKKTKEDILNCGDVML